MDGSRTDKRTDRSTDLSFSLPVRTADMSVLMIVQKLWDTVQHTAVLIIFPLIVTACQVVCMGGTRGQRSGFHPFYCLLHDDTENYAHHFDGFRCTLLNSLLRVLQFCNCIKNKTLSYRRETALQGAL